MALVIDGSNVVRGFFGFSQGDYRWDDLNSACFLSRLSDWAKGFADGSPLEVIFDGTRRRIRYRGKRLLSLLFARGRPGDDLVVLRARFLRHMGHTVTVVTSDKQLAERARKEEANVLHLRILWKRLLKGTTIL